MINKIRVYGKAQNRTALGIMNAYLVLNPNATFDDFVQTFPKSLNPDNGWPVIFKHVEDIDTDNEKNFFFTENDEVLTLANGTQMVVCKMWTKSSFDSLVEHSKQYAIEVAEFDKSVKGEKGGFRLEYINGFVPSTTKKGKSYWIWILLLIILIVIIAVVCILNK